MRLDTTSPLLLPHERRVLDRIVERLKAEYGRPPVHELPPGYREAIAEAFGDCGETGDLSERGEP